jgi:hypothetical protein
MAVDRAGLESCGVVVRNTQANAAVRGSEIEARAFPRVAGEVRVDTAVRRAAAHITR